MAAFEGLPSLSSLSLGSSLLYDHSIRSLAIQLHGFLHIIGLKVPKISNYAEGG